MRIIDKKITAKVLLVFGVGVYFLWVVFRPLKVIAVHQSEGYSIVLVKYYPSSDIDKIEWWLKNKEMLKEYFNIPNPDKDGRYNVILWAFGEGYKEAGKYDRLCFDDMKPPENCIDKNALMIISRDKYNVTEFRGDNGIYVLQKNGLIVKKTREE